MEHVEHFVEAEPLMAEEVVDGEAARRRPLNADGEVRRLLYLYEEASRAYRVRHSAFDEYRVAGFDVEAFERVEHAVEVLLVEELFPALARDAALEAEVDARLFAVYFASAEDVPAFRLAVRA